MRRAGPMQTGGSPTHDEKGELIVGDIGNDDSNAAPKNGFQWISPQSPRARFVDGLHHDSPHIHCHHAAVPAGFRRRGSFRSPPPPIASLFSRKFRAFKW